MRNCFTLNTSRSYLRLYNGTAPVQYVPWDRDNGGGPESYHVVDGIAGRFRVIWQCEGPSFSVTMAGK